MRWFVLFCVVSACEPAQSRDGGTFDASVDAGSTALQDSGVADAGVIDAGPQTTALQMTLGSRSAGFDRAQHGLDGETTLYIEAHFGGDPACPDSSSPTPDRTLIVANLPRVPDGGTLTSADGVRVTLLDFSGALTTAPLLRATTVRASPVEVKPGDWVSWSLEASFDGGSLNGVFVAPYCASLDG